MKLLIALLFVFPITYAQADDESAWRALNQGTAVAIMRHAIAPNGGPESELTREVCNGQRNLSQQGRDQAKKIGEVFRTNGIDIATVYSSSLCRAVDTAELLDFGDSAFLAEIDSFIDERSRSRQQSEQLKLWLSKTIENPSGANILVTHGFNIMGLVGYLVAQGDVVIVSVDNNGEVKTLATIDMGNL